MSGEDGNVVPDVDAPQSPSEAVAAADTGAQERPEWLDDNWSSPEQMAAWARNAGEVIRQQQEALVEANELLATVRNEAAEMSPDFAASSRAMEYLDANALRSIEMAAQEATLKRALQTVPGLADVMSVAVNEPARQAEELGSLLEQHVPDWGEFTNEINAAAAAFAGQDAETVVQGVAQVVERAKAERELMATRTNTMVDRDHMKRLAQSATGVGNRPTRTGGDAEAWAAIKAAGPPNYWEQR